MSRFDEEDFNAGDIVTSKELADKFVKNYEKIGVPVDSYLYDHMSKIASTITEQNPEKIKKETKDFHNVEVHLLHNCMAIVVDGEIIPHVTRFGEYKSNESYVVLWYEQMIKNQKGEFTPKDNGFASEIHFVKTDRVVFKNIKETR